MFALIGLGNPGTQYRLTRHNAGFLFIDYFSERLNIPFRPGKGDYWFCEGAFLQETIVLVKPVTFMNRSGLAVEQALDHFQLDQDNLLIVYDDFHLPFGTLRFRDKGSAGGHNGIKSIIAHLGNTNFKRLKLGIGSTEQNPVEYVLSGFDAEEIERLPVIFSAAFEGVTELLKTDINRVMNNYNRSVINDDQL